MSEDAVTKLCSACCTAKPIQAFRPEGAERTRRVCSDCVASREADKAGPKWDWAKALSKESAMHAERDKHHKSLYSSTLTPNILRVILALQNNCCALTGELFYFPGPDELKLNETLTLWRKKLPIELADRTPTLVRIDSSEKWEVGNVFLISSRWQEAYETFANINEFTAAIAKINNTKIPSKEAIIAKRVQ